MSKHSKTNRVHCPNDVHMMHIYRGRFRWRTFFYVCVRCGFKGKV